METTQLIYWLSSSENGGPQKSHSTSLADLPSHLIEKILSYCFRDRHQLKTVCKGFYEAIWKVCGHDFFLKLDAFNEKAKLEDILASDMSNCRPRSFSNVRMARIYKNQCANEVNEIILKLLKLKGHFVRSLKLKDCQQTQQTLSHMKNLTKLSLEGEIEFLDLKELLNLTEIEVYSCCRLTDIKLPENVIKSVLIVADKVTQADLCKFLAPIGSSLKNLKIDAENVEFSSNSTWNSLKLEKLTINSSSLNSFSKIFPNQSNLTFLDLPTAISDEVLDLIAANLMKLKNFCVNLSRIRPESFDKLARLKSLKRLKIYQTNFHDLLLGDSKLQIQAICLNSCQISSVEAAKSFVRKFPELKILELNEDCRLPILPFQEVISGLLKLEKFTFERGLWRENYGRPLKPSKVPNENLKTLKINILFQLDLNFLRNFPNLTEIDLKIDNRQVGSLKKQVEAIFREFSKLKRIFLFFFPTFCLDFDIFEYPNLELVRLMNVNLNYLTSIEAKKQLKNYEICQVKREKSFDSEIEAYSLLLVADAEILRKCKKSFMPRRPIYNYHADSVIYYKALKYPKCI